MDGAEVLIFYLAPRCYNQFSCLASVWVVPNHHALHGSAAAPLQYPYTHTPCQIWVSIQGKKNSLHRPT